MGEMLLLEQFCLMPFLFVRSKGLISMGFRAARAALRRNSGRTPYADPADAGFFFTAGRLAGEPGSFPGDRNSELSPTLPPPLVRCSGRWRPRSWRGTIALPSSIKALSARPIRRTARHRLHPHLLAAPRTSS